MEENKQKKKPGRKKIHHTKMVKLPFAIPVYCREMVVRIAELQKTTGSNAVIEMIAEAHRNKVNKEGEA
jgi:hypothetical protein